MSTTSRRLELHLGWLAVTVVAVVLTVLIQKALVYSRHTARLSDSGQTLKELAVLLDDLKQDQGAYPDSLEGIDAGKSTRKLTSRSLEHIIYIKSGDTYTAFVGVDSSAWVSLGRSPQFKP